jgi:outer membrane cobalamin receptor
MLVNPAAMLKTATKVFAILLLISIKANAQEEIGSDLDSLIRMSAFTEESELQKKLNQNLTVSSAKALTTRETPSIISLITAEEIQNSGARDLMDILRLVPGFEIGQDLQFVLGLGLRGSWANEGKVLVMVDGQQFNELLYQGVAMGNRFQVDAIERIEIIRGPGSAIYGGSAEYGVINIITKAASTLKGVTVYGVGGFHANDVGRTNGGIILADRSEKMSWDLSLFNGKGIVSDNSYTSLYQDTVVSDLANATNSDPLNFNAGLRVGGLEMRAMYDQFKTSEPFTYISFKSLYADVKYDWKVSDKLSITPQFKYTNQIPWQYGYFADGDVFKARAERYYASVSANYNASRKVNLNYGFIYFQDKATDMLKADYFLGANTVSFNNLALFAQSLIKHRLANATIGFRYERNSQYGSAFVPRLALTKKIENLHFKVLYSQSFRAPSIENINLSSDANIKPEKSQAYELEVGYQFTPEMLLAVNAFKLQTKNVIVYAVTIENLEGLYQNFDHSGSQGVELVYSIRKKGWYSQFSYSFSQAGKNTVASYAVPQTTKQFVGLPVHKFTLNTNFNLTESLTFNPTFIYGGARYAYTTIDENEIPVTTKLDPYLLANAFLNYRNIVPGLTGGIGVYDILNAKPSIAQAYNGDYAPVPGRSREYVVKLSYQLNFKK